MAYGAGMSADLLNKVSVGYQVFLADGGEEVGAVRDVRPPPRSELLVYVENGGDFVVAAAAITAVHSQKVILDVAHLEPKLRAAITHAHDAEVPGL